MWVFMFLAVATAILCKDDGETCNTNFANLPCNTNDWYSCYRANSAPYCCHCKPGTVSNSDYSDCVNCPWGKYESNSGNSLSGSCSDCMSGKYSLLDTTDCTNVCYKGYYCTDGVQRSCMQGSFTIKSFASTCTLCTAGKFSNVQNQWFPLQINYVDTQSTTYVLTFKGKFNQDAPVYETKISDAAVWHSNFAWNWGPYSGIGIWQWETVTMPTLTWLKIEEVNFLKARYTYEMCLPCALNFTSSTSGSTFCTSCPANSFTILTGSTSCITCSVGNYFDYSVSSCYSCSAGKYLNSPWYHPKYIIFREPWNQWDLIMMFQGSYTADGLPIFQNATHDVALWFYADWKAWLYGYTSWMRSTTYFSAAGSVISVTTSVNSWLNYDALKVWNSKSYWCIDCPDGSISTAAGMTYCTQCAPGYFASSKTLCSPCSAGTYQANFGATTCLTCQAGSILMSSSSCVQCVPGKYQINSVCQDCASGMFQSNYGATTCVTCQAGSVTIAGSSCVECAPGKYQINSVCQDCAAGKYQSNSGSTVCLSCTICTDHTMTQCAATTNSVCCAK